MTEPGDRHAPVSVIAMAELRNKLAAKRGDRKVANAVALETRRRRQLAFVSGLIEGVAASLPIMSVAQCEEELIGLNAIRERIGPVPVDDDEALNLEALAALHAGVLAKLDALQGALEQRIGVN